jgi:hypothetical protein
MLALDADAQPRGNGEWQIADEMREAVDVLAAKLTKGIFYRHTGAIFPKGGGLIMTWYTNGDVIVDGGYKLFDVLKHIPGDAPMLMGSTSTISSSTNSPYLQSSTFSRCKRSSRTRLDSWCSAALQRRYWRNTSSK